MNFFCFEMEKKMQEFMKFELIFVDKQKEIKEKTQNLLDFEYKVDKKITNFENEKYNINIKRIKPNQPKYK